MTESLRIGESFAGFDICAWFDQVSFPVTVVNGASLNYVYANEAYLQLVNCKQIKGKNVEEFFNNDRLYRKKLEDVTSLGAIVHHPRSFFQKNKSAVRYFDFIHTPLKNHEGVIEAILIVGEELNDAERQDAIRFRNIVENSADPILILKGNDLVLDVANEALLKLWGVDKRALGQPFLDILPEMKEQGIYDLLLEVYNKGITHYGHERPIFFKRPDSDNDLHYFNFIYQPYKDENGNITGVLVLANDVTSQVIAKKKLEKSELNFRNMILQAPVAMCILRGPHHVVEIANARMFELWGKAPELLAGKPLFEGLPEVRGQGFEELLQNVYTTGQRFQANERQVSLPREGRIETVYVNFVYEAYYDGDGTISAIIVVATEVTEQVNSRQKIEYVEANAPLAIESADLGTYEINLQTNEMFTSHRFNAIWGLDEPTTDRTKFAAVIHPDDLNIREEAHKDSLKTGNLHYEARIVQRDGSYRWVRIKGKVLFDDKGTAQRLLGVIQDISEQKQFSNELSKQVSERTKALEEANQQLKQTNEELEQFAYVTSHDLQEPLRKIRFFTNYILDHNDTTETGRKYIEKINSAAQRMSGLIQTLLDYSRLSQKSVHFEKVNLNEIVKAVISDFELLVDQKQATIHQESLPMVEAIPLQMNQLFFNLIGNALKFTRRNIQPSIKIASRKLQAHEVKELPNLDVTKEYVEIQIIDNGIGFNEEYADRIFTIFQRLNNSSTYGGYGIGLALCKKIVENHCGFITARSKPGEGATFIFVVPYSQKKHF